MFKHPFSTSCLKKTEPPVRERGAIVAHKAKSVEVNHNVKLKVRLWYILKLRRAQEEKSNGND